MLELQTDREPQAMSDSPKHEWFRFHLLTAVLMMVAAGILLAVELCPLGWFMRDAWSHAPEVIGYVSAGDFALIVAIALICESLIRRREARKL